MDRSDILNLLSVLSAATVAIWVFAKPLLAKRAELSIEELKERAKYNREMAENKWESEVQDRSTKALREQYTENQAIQILTREIEFTRGELVTRMEKLEKAMRTFEQQQANTQASARVILGILSEKKDK